MIGIATNLERALPELKAIGMQTSAPLGLDGFVFGLISHDGDRMTLAYLPEWNVVAEIDPIENLPDGSQPNAHMVEYITSVDQISRPVSAVKYAATNDYIALDILREFAEWNGNPWQFLTTAIDGIDINSVSRVSVDEWECSATDKKYADSRLVRRFASTAERAIVLCVSQIVSNRILERDADQTAAQA